MHVFITGAHGFIGRATVQELIKHGHQVTGLVRSDAATETLTKLGAKSLKGDLKDLESLKRGAKVADGVIQLAFSHDFNDMAGACATDYAAIEAMGEALAGTEKPLIIASGALGLPKGSLSTEDTEPLRNTPLSDRAKSEDLVYALSKEKQVRGIVVRFSPTVHGEGDKGFVPVLANMSRKNGTVIYIDDGSARWPAVHRDDAAVLLRLALEKGTAGATYHAVAEEGVAMKDTMAVVSKHLKLPLQSQSVEKATGSLGFFATLIGSDHPTSSEKTRKELGWHPTRPGLLADVDANYFP